MANSSSHCSPVSIPPTNLYSPQEALASSYFTRRKEEEDENNENKKKAPLHNFPNFNSTDWNTSLFTDFFNCSDKESCCESIFFLPCITHSLISAKQDSETGFLGKGRILGEVGREYFHRTCCLSTSFQILLPIFGCMICSGTLRSSFIQEYDFSGYVADAEFGHCCTGCCCCFCSNAQVYRELVLRGAPPLHPITGRVRPERNLSNGMGMLKKRSDVKILGGEENDDDDNQDGNNKKEREVTERSRLLAQG